MGSDVTSYGRPVPPRRRWPRRSREAGPGSAHPASSALEDVVELESIGRRVNVYDLCSQPSGAVLAVEDTCWRFARQDWLARRPSRFARREWRAWQAEGRRLDEKRERITELAGAVARHE